MSIQTARRIRFAGTLLFLLYMTVLIYLLFFSEHYGRTADIRELRYNLVPFREIARCWVKRGRLGMHPFVVNVLGNIAAFAPLGAICPVLRRDWRSPGRLILVGFGLSLCVEILQLLTRVGCFDVDDILLNTFGTAVGYSIFAVCNLIRRKWDGRKKGIAVQL